MSRKISFVQFRKEIEKNINLSDEDKNEWVSNFSSYPGTLINYFYQILQKDNKQTEIFIKKAIDLKPELVTGIKIKAKKIKAKVEEMKTLLASNQPEKVLEEALEKL